jgi:acetolactate synthase-1/2/3 large subunit
VVLSLPEDMLTTECMAQKSAPYVRLKAHPGGRDMEAVRGLLGAARRPLVIVGGGDWSASACNDLARFAQLWNLPVACSFRRQDVLDNRSANYVGEIGIGISAELKKRVAEADLVVVVGARLGEMTTGGYTMFGIPRPVQKFVHVYPGVEELGRVYAADLMINSGMAEFAAAAKDLPVTANLAWPAWTSSLRQEYLETLKPVTSPGNLNLSKVVQWLRENLPAGSIITNGAGNFSGWAQRFFQYTGYRTQLAPTNGAMGYGVPAAVAASLVYPERSVVCFSGDGDFMMNGQELATAAQYGSRAIFLVVNNGMYGTIRMHQEKEYPGRVHGSQLSNPDFAALARAYGLHGETVLRDDEFPAAFARAQSSGTAALIELQIDPEAITTRTTLAKIRDQARASGR